MAQTDLKAPSELDLFNNALNENSLLPMTVNLSGSNTTRKVYYPALKTQIAGYELTGVLTAGNTSITLSSVGTTYNDQNAYTAGSLVTYTGVDEVVRNYICIKSCAAANWETNSRYFVEYTPIGANSYVDIYTSVYGVNPTDVSVANNAITLTFEAQSNDVGVKVRVL